MTQRLRMSAELGDWLAELCTSEPASAAEVGAAITAVMDADDQTALAFVSAPSVDRLDPREEVDLLYQSLLDALQAERVQVAEIATIRAGAERLLAQLDRDPEADPAVQAWLQQTLDRAKRQEAALAKRSQRLQAEVDQFRTAKESAKAMYTAADASVRVHDAIEAAESESGQPSQVADAELTDLNRGLEAADAHLQAIATEAYQTLRSLMDETGRQADHVPTGPAQPVAGLLELRADPFGRDVRLLLAHEPVDTVTLLAVLDGQDAIAAHRAQAIRLAGDLLTDVRAGDWPSADAGAAADIEVTFADSATFLVRFFPSQAGLIAARAASLATAQSAAGLRGSTSLAELAQQTGLSEQRLHEIEDGGLRVAQVHEAVAYVRGLGGRLELTAELGDSAPVQLT